MVDFSISDMIKLGEEYFTPLLISKRKKVKYDMPLILIAYSC